MSLVRSIKTLLAVTIIIVTFAAWVTINYLAFDNTFDYKLFFITMPAVFLMQFLCVKKYNKYLSVIVPVSASFPFIYLLSDGLAILANMAFVIFLVIYCFDVEKAPISYEQHRIKVTHGTAALSIIALFSFGLDNPTANYIYRLIINFIIVIVILLRDSRAYCYEVKIEDKELGSVSQKLLLKYAIIIVSTIVLSNNWILNKSLGLLSVINKGIDILIDSVTKLLSSIIGLLYNLLSIIVREAEPILKFLQKQGGKGTDPIKNDPKEIRLPFSEDMAAVNNSAKVIILIITILLIIYVARHNKFLKLKREDKKEEYAEAKEKLARSKITINNRKKINEVQLLLKRIFAKNSTIKDKILNTYRNFEKLTDKAKIYKTHMTATQLKAVTKAHLKNDDYLEEMTNIYNEAKFSNKSAQDSQLRTVKQAYENIKNQL